jgi:hypothetical protein
VPLNQTLRKNSNVLWTISLIQDQNPEAQTKAEFAEMANEVLDTPTIKTVTLCLADSLQRFRLMIEDGITEKEAISKCQELSEIWHNDNSEASQKLTKYKNLSLLTWQEFRSWSDYDKTIKEVESLYKENRDFRMAVDGRVRQARENIKEDAKIADPLKQTELLKMYLLEECAFQKFGAIKGFNYEIYKTQQSKAMRRIKNNNDFVPPGTMVEVNFTQFYPSERKQIVQNSVQNNENKSLESISFNPIFNCNLKKPHVKPATVEPSLLLKATEFIEKTLALVPLHQQEQAVHAILKFTNQEIVPLCYANKLTVVNT